MKRAIILAAALATLACGAQAQDLSGVVFAGGTVADGFSAYAGGLKALPGSRLGDGWAARAVANVGRYHYEAGPTDIDADYKGLGLALMRQWSSPAGSYGNLAIGPQFTHTKLSPLDPANDRRGDRTDLILGSDGSLAMAPAWRLGWYGAYGVFDQSYQAQLRLGRLVSQARQTQIGVEGALLGDPTYKSHSVGAFASTALGGQWIGQISGGVSFQQARDDRAYVSVSVSRVF